MMRLLLLQLQRYLRILILLHILNMFLLTTGYRSNVSLWNSGRIRRSLKAFPSLLATAPSPSLHSSQLSTESKAHKEKPGVIFVLGGPGAGKGTQCELISKEFGIAHLSAGELLRQERLSGSENGKLIDAYLKEGRIVPVSFSLSLLQREIARLGQQRYLIDGFPRNYDNLHGWMETMSGICDIELILYIDCDEEELTKRLLQRGLTSNRNDDNLSTIKKRFVTFNAETLPVIRHFQQSADSFNYVSVNGDADKSDVYRQIEERLLPLLSRDVVAANEQLSSTILARDSDVSSYTSLSENDGKQWLEMEKQQMLEHGLRYANKVNVTVKGTTARYDCTLSDESGQRRAKMTRDWKFVAGQWRLAGVRYSSL